MYVALFILVGLIIYSWHKKKDKEGMRGARDCCVYAYYEKDNASRENLTYFLKHGLSCPNVDYYVVVNGDTDIEFPEEVVVMRRENVGYCFGGHSYALKHIPLKYNHYYFMNTSVTGPFGVVDWVSRFNTLFTDDVKLVGTTINIEEGAKFEKIFHHPPPYTHVQSMFFGLDQEALDYLIQDDFFNETRINNYTFDEVIAHCEIGMSQKILQRGWNLNSILPELQGLDYRTLTKNINPTSRNSDPYYVGAYFGRTLKKEDVIFFKTNRGLPF